MIRPPPPAAPAANIPKVVAANCVATLILCRQAFAQAEAHSGSHPALLRKNLSPGKTLARATGPRRGNKGQPMPCAHPALNPVPTASCSTQLPFGGNSAPGKTAAFTHVLPDEIPKRMPEKIRYAAPRPCQEDQPRPIGQIGAFLPKSSAPLPCCSLTR